MSKKNIDLRAQAAKIIKNTARHKFHHALTDAEDELNLTDDQYDKLYKLIKTANIEVSWD